MVLLISLSSVANANTIVRQVVSTGGGQMTANGNTLAYTIGLPIMSTNYSTQVTNGFFWANGGNSVTQPPLDLVMVVDTASVCPDESFDVTFKINATSEQPVEGVQMYLKFDTAILQVKKITNGTALDSVLRKDVSAAGYINFASASFTNPPQTNSFDLVTVRFKALQKTAGTRLQIDANNSNLQSQGNYLALQASDKILAIGDCLKCKVTLQGRKAKPHDSWITPLDIHTAEIQTITTSNRGYCKLPITVTPGNSSFCVKNSHTLANKIGPPINAAGTVNLGTLLEGDVDNDNDIDFTDITILKKSLNKCSGQNGYNSNADLNMDTCVNKDDVSTAFGTGDGKKSNFGRPSACSLDKTTNTLRRGVRDGSGAVSLSTTLVPTGLPIGSTFEVAIQVNADEAQSIDGTAAYLNFDPNRLQVNTQTAGEHFDFVLRNDFDNTKGEINFAATSWEMAFPKGNFTLVTINFTLLNPGGAQTLAFNNTGHRKTVSVSKGESVTASENVGEVEMEKLVLPEVPDGSNVEGLPNHSQDDDGIEIDEAVDLPDPNEDDGTSSGYTVKGTISDKADNPIADVTVQVGDKSVVTDEAGNWEITGLAKGEYTATATKDKLEFESQNFVVDGENVTLNFEAEEVIIGDYTAYGTIRDELGNKLAGVKVQVAGKTVTTDAAGNWEVSNLPEGEYTVTVSKDGYTFAPKNVALGNDEFRQESVLKPLSNLKVKVVAEPRTVKQDDNVTYIATVINGGAETATGVVLTDTLPANAGGLISIETLDGGQCDADTVTCTLPDLTTGNSARVKFVVSNTQAKSLLNTATVTANEYPADVQKTRTRVIPHLAVSITDTPDPLQLPEPGEERVLHYDVATTLSANAPSAATGVNLVMTLPKGVEMQAVNSDNGMCDTSELPIITCSMTDLSVASVDDISQVTVGIDVVLKDAGLLALMLEAKVSANEYPVHQDKERTSIFIEPKYKVGMAFVIDDSGSMQSEINSVKAAINDVIDEILTTGDTPPLSVLLTFGDQVKYRAVTQDMTVLRDAVAKLKASGGGTCPEASFEAISFAIPHLNEGGTILFATDASAYEGSDTEDMMARLRSNGIVFNTMLFGDCSDENSWNQPDAE